ncbi:MAG TPA: RDD family protein [Candidatus Sulfopaludibacter sp.]|jgi:uncharacterized RDD family membrane protein YckC|nr:RDD family protein [Candidatus Sulfopaludibacter sp.]
MSTSRQRSLVIQTPEGVVFSYELATPALRALAWVVDAAAIGTAAYVAGKIADVFGHVSQDWAGALGAVLFFLASIGYGIVLEWRWRGQTIGKRLFRLRVVDAQGLRLQFPQVAIRNLLRLVDSMPLLYLIGGTASLVTRRCQRLGDLAANTVVARERVFEEPDLEQIAPAKYNSLLAYPHLAARLRSLASPEAVGLAIQAATQRNTYSPGARIELFGELAGYFQSLVVFPPATIEGLTNEQYVRSVLRVVMAPSGR